jgi:hypothetical protein
LLDHLNGDGFDSRSGRPFPFPCGFLNWRGFGVLLSTDRSLSAPRQALFFDGGEDRNTSLPGFDSLTNAVQTALERHFFWRYQTYFAASAITTIVTITNAAICTQKLLAKPLLRVI